MAAKKRRQRPALVSAYLEGVSAKALESYQDIIRDLIVREQGFYALYKGKRLYYVGLASNLRRRIRQHLRDRYSRVRESRDRRDGNELPRSYLINATE